MSEPTGTLTRISPDDCELAISRQINAPVEDVWASVTESDRTALWIGPWSGTAGPAETVILTMKLEDGDPESPVRIVTCEEPTHLEVVAGEEPMALHLEVRLSVTDTGTEFTLVHHLDDPAQAAVFGGGWDFYADCLLASRDGRTLPSFDDYNTDRFLSYYANLTA